MRDRRSARRARLVAAFATIGLLAGSACSSDGGSDAETERSTTTATEGTTGAATDAAEDPAPGGGHECDLGASLDPVQAAPVPDVESDLTLTSFDGTEIRIHWFPAPEATADAPAPTVLMGPGWSLPGDTSADGDPIFGALGISNLHEAGYNVLTWDPRGFGESTGSAQVNAPDAEGRDGQALLDFVAEQPEAQLDAEGDPRAGMVGGSYGGGIQLTLSALDCRVDAIVPNVAWHSLETSLFKARTVKAGWSSLLSNIAAGSSLDPHIPSAAASGLSTGTLSTEDETWFRDRGPGDLVDDITVPTLFVHGTVDTLFTLDEAMTNHASLLERDVPVAMLWYCGGHGACLTEAGDEERAAVASFAWLDRYLKGDEGAPEVPAFSTVDQDGVTWTADRFPLDAGDPIVATAIDGSDGFAGALALTAESAAGPLDPETVGEGVLDGLVTGITPAQADVAVEVPIEIGVDALSVGAPGLAFSYVGTSPDGERPTRVFAQLVDDETGLVLGNQITPIEVVLDGENQTAEVDLEVIAHHLTPGGNLTLQLVATTPAYAEPRLGGEITFQQVTISVPTSTGAEPA